MLIHGTADSIVPYTWSVDTARALLGARVPAFLQLLDGAGHVPYAQYFSQIYSQADYFFYDFLDLAHAAGQPPSATRALKQAAKVSQQYPSYAKPLRGKYSALSR